MTSRRRSTLGKASRFVVVSVVTVVVGQILLFGLFVGLDWSASWANAVAFVLSGILSYVLNRNWTWGRRGRSDLWREVVPFWVIAVLGLAVSTWMADIAARRAQELTNSRLLQGVAVDAAVFLSVGVLWVAKYLALGRVFDDKQVAPPTMPS